MNNIVSTILTISIKSSVLFLVFLLLRNTMRKRINPLIVSRAWVILFILTCIPFSIASDYSWESIVPDQEVTRQIKSIPTQVGQVIYTLPQLNTSAPKRRLNVSLIIYMAGFFGMFVFYTVQHERLRRSRRNVNKLRDEYKSMVNYKGSVSVVTTKLLGSPAVMGLFKPNIYLPEHMIKELSINEMKHIFIHELCHLKSKDHLLNYLLLAYKIVFWFNPLTHYFFKVIKEDMEYACDYRVKKILGKEEWKLYGHTLLNLASLITHKKQYIVAPLAENKHALRERIEQLISTKKHSKLLIIVIVVALTLVGCVMFTESKATVDESTPSNVTSTERTSNEVVIEENASELTMEQAQVIVESKKVELLENYQFFMRTEYLKETGESVGWISVFPIVSNEESSALYMRVDGNEVSLYIDEFSGTLSTDLMESYYTIQYGSVGVSVDPNMLFDKDYSSIDTMIEENNLEKQYIRFIENQSSPLREVYLLTKSNNGVAYLTEDREIIGSRLIDITTNKVDLQVMFSDDFYSESVKNFDYDHLINVTIPEVKAYFPTREELLLQNAPVDMDNHYIVFLSNGMMIKVLKEDNSLFLIQNAYQDLDEYGEPLSEEMSQTAVERFIAATPLKDWSLTLEEISFEYKFDSQEKEYYVFTYKRPNDDMVYIKYNTYFRTIDSFWY